MAETVPSAEPRPAADLSLPISTPTPPPAGRTSGSSFPNLPTPSLGEEWPRQATDAVVKVVDSVRDKTTGPAVNAAHAAKYGIVAGVMGAVLGVALLIGFIRGSEALLQVIATWQNLTWLSDPIWIVYLFYGVLFALVGLWLFRRANRPAKRP